MSKVILVLLFILACALTAFPQKSVTAIGDSWIGEVSSVNEVTREITLIARGKDKDESFTGVLKEGFSAQLLDGSIKEPKITEIPLGMHVRLFYETQREAVGGQKKKINHVLGMIFLGRDSFDRLRARLKMAPSTPVTRVKDEGFPSETPLKLHILIESPKLKDAFVKWVGKWNKGEASKYGSIELVPELSQAHVSLVVYLTDSFFSLPGPGDSGDMHFATTRVSAFLVVPQGDVLTVLWEYKPIFPVRNRDLDFVGDEIKKRLKARSNMQKK